MTGSVAPVLALRKAGPADKPILVLLHGFGGSGHHFDAIVEPLVSAVYAADMEKLSILATLPRMFMMRTLLLCT